MKKLRKIVFSFTVYLLILFNIFTPLLPGFGAIAQENTDEQTAEIQPTPTINPNYVPLPTQNIPSPTFIPTQTPAPTIPQQAIPTSTPTNTPTMTLTPTPMSIIGHQVPNNAPTPTNTPTPIPVFSNLSSQMPYDGSAVFSFDFSGTAGSYYVNVSTLADMSYDVYLAFASGTQSPITVSNPRKWDKYSCNRTLYWKVISSTGIESDIQATAVSCPWITPSLTSTPSPAPTSAPVRDDVAGVINKKALLLIYDPILRNGRKLSKEKNWSYDASVQNAIDFFRNVSNNRVNLSVVEKVELNKWPVKLDGFSYTEDTYMAVLNGTVLPHSPDIMDYYQFLNDPTLDICSRFNRGEFDEVWTFAGPWFGFYESALATSLNGPVGFPYNGPTFNRTSCNKLMAIGIPGPHTFGHRAEASMTKVYGGWEENRTAHAWDKFGLDKAQSPNYNQFGCGSIHYAPNSLTLADDYDFNLTNTTRSYCDDFYNYPNLSDMNSVAKEISCTAWNCTTEGYEQWWWKHLPKYKGYGPDGKLNDWWQYVLDPNVVLTNAVPTLAPTSMPTNTPTGTLSPTSTVIPTPTPLTNRYIKVLQPNGGEILTAGQLYEIKWEQNLIDKVMIGYVTPDYMEWISTGTPTSGPNGSYLWLVPQILAGKSNLLIKIIAYQTGVGSSTDQSDSGFAVVPTPTQTPAPSVTNTPAPTDTPTPTATDTPTPTPMEGAGNNPYFVGEEVRLLKESTVAEISPITDLTITKEYQSLKLNWSEVENASFYKIYRAKEPYFNPSTENLIAYTYDTTYLDNTPGITGDPDNNYFYVVRALGPGHEADNSNRVGEFDYQVLKGKNLLIAPPFALLPFSDGLGFAQYLGLTDGIVLKQNNATQGIIWLLLKSGKILAGQNFTITPGDIIGLVRNGGDGEDKIITFVGQFPTSNPSYLLQKGTNNGISMSLLYKDIHTATELGNQFLPYAKKIYDGDANNIRYIEYKDNQWIGEDFPVKPGFAYSVELLRPVFWKYGETLIPGPSWDSPIIPIGEDKIYEVYQGREFVLQTQVSDPDTSLDNLSYEIAHQPEGGLFDKATLQYRITPTGEGGYDAVEIWVSDGTSKDKLYFRFHFNPAPVITITPPVTLVPTGYILTPSPSDAPSPTQTPTPTATITPTPTVTPTPTIISYWYSFGPKGEPSEDWNTAEELLAKLNTNNVKATEIDRWLNGGWDAHIYQLPFNNFPVVEGQGYFIKFTGEKEALEQVLQGFTYTPVYSSINNIIPGWNFLSIPEGILDGLGNITAEDLCYEINKQQGNIAEVADYPIQPSGDWIHHECTKPENNFPIQNGRAYFIKALESSLWIRDFTTPTPTETPTSTPAATNTPTPTETPVPTATPTPSFVWYNLGPKGVPGDDWNTAKELLAKLNLAGIKASEIHQWKYGGWKGHVYQLPFNNFEIKEGVGYLLKVEGSAQGIEYILSNYSPVESYTYNINVGWNFVSFPEGVFNWLGNTTGENLCASINSQGGNISEIIGDFPVITNGNTWNGRLCGSQEDFNIQAGRSYMVQSPLTSSVWMLNAPTPTATNTPSPTPTATSTPTPTQTPVPTATPEPASPPSNNNGGGGNNSGGGNNDGGGGGGGGGSSPKPAPTPFILSNNHPWITTIRLGIGKYTKAYYSVVSARDHNRKDKLTITASGLPVGLYLSPKCSNYNNKTGAYQTCSIFGKPLAKGVSFITFIISDQWGYSTSKTLVLIIK